MYHRAFIQVGGSVSVGSHGSSPLHGTISDMVVGLDIILGDSTFCSLGPKLGVSGASALGISESSGAGAWADRVRRIRPEFDNKDLIRAA